MVEWEAVERDESDEADATCRGVSVAEIEQVLAAGPVFRPYRRGSDDHLVEGVPTVADVFGWSWPVIPPGGC